MTAPIKTLPDDLDERVGQSFLRWQAMGLRHPQARRVRHDIIMTAMPLARRLALRFRSRGEPVDDLIQVAVVGLINSVDRFDVGRGIPFSRYAVPTILGELKRHFRDKGWALRVGRRMQELYLDIRSALPELNQLLGTSPTMAQVAEHLGRDVTDVLSGLDSARGYSPRSLSAPAGDGIKASAFSELIGAEDADLALVTEREALYQVIRGLPEQQQRVLALRFFGNLTQQEIADRENISQMQVSRLLTRALAALRARMTD